MLSVFQKVWCWLGIAINSIGALRCIVSLFMIDSSNPFVGDITYITTYVGIAVCVIHAACIAWLLFSQKRVAFWALMWFHVIHAIVALFLGSDFVRTVFEAGLSMLIDWLIFKSALENMN